MKKEKNILITVIALVVVAAVTLIGITASKTALDSMAHAQKGELMVENNNSEPNAVAYEEKDGQKEKDLSQAELVVENPELTALMMRLEKAGVSYELQLAVQNNQASGEVIAGLNKLMDDLDATSENSEEREKLLELINEYEMMGINEAVGEEIEKADAQQIAAIAMKDMFGVKIAKDVDEQETEYKAAGIYAKNDGRAFWDIEDATDKVWYYVTIDALTGDILDASWLSKKGKEGAGEVDVSITQNQLDSYMSAAQSFVSDYLLKDDMQIVNSLLGEGSKNGENYMIVGPTAVIDVTLNNGTIVHNRVNIETTNVIGFYKSMVWDK